MGPTFLISPVGSKLPETLPFFAVLVFVVAVRHFVATSYQTVPGLREEEVTLAAVLSND